VLTQKSPCAPLPVFEKTGEELELVTKRQPNNPGARLRSQKLLVGSLSG